MSSCSFYDGNFSENETFLLTDWFKHTAPEILAKNFGVPAAAFADIPQDVEHERYIFPAPMPGPLGADAVQSPAGAAPQTFSHRLMDGEPVEAAGGWARIVDSSNFPAASTIAAALGGGRPGRDARAALASQHRRVAVQHLGKRPHDRVRVRRQGAGVRLPGGDVGYVPFAMGHYVENTGDEPLRFLELFRSDHFADVSLNQWMALTPPELVQAHLNLDPETMARLSKDKPVVVGPARVRAHPVRLPHWPEGAIAVLSTMDEAPHAIPVTAPVRAGDRRILLSLKRDRASLTRLRERPQVALSLLAEGNEAAEIVESGVGVRWTDENGPSALRERVDVLRELAEGEDDPVPPSGE